jgi:hypothetical protein
MGRPSASFLRIIFAFVILFLAGVVSLAIRASLHSQNDRITGIAFLVAVVCLVLFSERIFPLVYTRSTRRPIQWWQTRGAIVVISGVIISILSSRIATLWFGLVVVSGVLVALLLHAAGSNEL